MTVEELLRPRFEVIADYPESPYPVGEIIERTGKTTFFEKYPAIFKPLPWWSHRKIEDMPEYVKYQYHNDSPIIFKSEKWDMGMPNQVSAMFNRSWYYTPYISPATLSDYTTFTEKK